jgi:hypothetical protein
VLVGEYLDGTIAVSLGPNLLGRYDAAGALLARNRTQRELHERGRAMKADKSCGKPR